MLINRKPRISHLRNFREGVRIEVNLYSFHCIMVIAFLISSILSCPPTPIVHFPQNGSILCHLLNQFMSSSKIKNFTVLAQLYSHKFASTGSVLPPSPRLFIDLDEAHCFFLSILILSPWTPKSPQQPLSLPLLHFIKIPTLPEDS